MQFYKHKTVCKRISLIKTHGEGENSERSIAKGTKKSSILTSHLAGRQREVENGHWALKQCTDTTKYTLALVRVLQRNRTCRRNRTYRKNRILYMNIICVCLCVYEGRKYFKQKPYIYKEKERDIILKYWLRNVAGKSEIHRVG